LIHLEHARIEAAREALRTYVRTILFDEANPEGEALREALLLARRGGGARERLLRAVDLWGPGAPEWRAVLGSDDGVTYAGRVLQLYTEVRVDGRGKIEHTAVCLD
jgi:hypothetical protein